MLQSLESPEVHVKTGCQKNKTPLPDSIHIVADSVVLNGVQEFGFLRNSHFIPMFLVENYSFTIWLHCRVTRSKFFDVNKSVHQELKMVGFYCYL